MASINAPVQRLGRGVLPRVFALAAVLSVPIAVAGRQQGKLDFLHIGTSHPMTGGERNEKSSLETLRGFIKDETGLDSEIIRQKDWRELAEKMSKGQLEVGVFQGFEFAWAKEKYPDLKPLALAVNIYVYPIVYVVTKSDKNVSNFAGLKGHSLALVSDGPAYLKLYAERQSEAGGKKLDTFFSKVSSTENFEDALDDVVDGVVDATVVDRAALEAYKRRKPARFSKLTPVAQSQPLPPAVIACYGSYLGEDNRKRFTEGLLNAKDKEKGQTMLTLFKLTGFQTPPDARAAYPPEGNGTK
jgi:ABC-type phosphate/phosphonate transport system substrate-binding protein